MNSTTLQINTDQLKFPLGDLYGIFFEDINHAADGGLYAELVRNRSFEFDSIDHKGYHALTAWHFTPQGDASIEIRKESPVSLKNPHYAVISLKEGNFCLANEGYHKGMYITKGSTYYASFYGAATPFSDTPFNKVTLSLETVDGAILASSEIVLSNQWKNYEVTLTVAATSDKVFLCLKSDLPGSYSFDFVSLFPTDTYKGRRNGLRKDLATAIEELKPKFMRFPGGCLIHDGNLDQDARDSLYRWKNTIGPLEDRPARAGNWGYNQTLGLGYFEYFLFCEDIGAKPIPVLPAAYNPHAHEAVPIEELGEWIEDALDLIEFANGDFTTTWGKIRANLGHPEPFHMEYLAIGNEELGAPFMERYPYFHNAIREKYPEIKLISSSGPFADGYDFDLMWEEAEKAGADLVDEHYYMAPDWMLKHTKRYDAYKRDGAKVFLGEYASLDNKYKNALYEAAYMTGIERNADKVSLACYAPLLCNKDYVNWKPDMIWYNHKKMMKSINYHVQKMFLTNQGTDAVESILSTETPNQVIPVANIAGRIGFASENPSVVVSKVSINGITLDTDVTITYNKTTKKLASDSLLATIEPLEETKKSAVLYPAVFEDSFKVCFDFIKTKGKGQFKFIFGLQDGRYYQWELGGWANDMSHLGRCDITTVGKKSIKKYGGINVGRELIIEEHVPYHAEVTVTGHHIRAVLNGELYHDFEEIDTVIPALYQVVSKDDDAVYAKIVNVRTTEQPLTVTLSGSETYKHVEITTLQTDDLAAMNTFLRPNAVAPSTKLETVSNNSYEITILPTSVHVLKFVK